MNQDALNFSGRVCRGMDRLSISNGIRGNVKLVR